MKPKGNIFFALINTIICSRLEERSDEETLQKVKEVLKTIETHIAETKGKHPS